MRSSLNKGFFWAAVSVFAWGTLFPVGRLLIGEGRIDPASLGMFRFGIAGAVMLAAGAAVKGVRAMLPPARRDWVELALLGFVGAGLMSLFLFAAQRTIPSINASMLDALSPLLIFLLTVAAGKRFTLFQSAGFLAGFAGCLLVLKVLDGGGFHIDSLAPGDLLILCGALCWALYTIFARGAVVRLGGYRVTVWSMLFGALLLGGIRLGFAGAVMPSEWGGWGLVVYTALVPSALAFLGWNQAQKSISLGLLALTAYAIPLASALFALLLLGETLTLWQLAGAVIVTGAVLTDPEAAAFCRARCRIGKTQQVES